MIINKLINATTQIIEPNYRMLVKYTLNIHKIHILWEKKNAQKMHKKCWLIQPSFSINQ